MSKSYSFIITHNNPKYASGDLEKLYKQLGADYFVGQFEIGSAEGTHHLQAFVHYKRQQRISRITKILVGAHVECARSDE